MEETLDQISPILPMDFFRVQLPLHPAKKMKTLPDFSELLIEDSFAKVDFGWENKGLSFFIKIDAPFEECFFPEYRKGDSVELFLDTRDLKTAGFPTRFCHHFVLFAKPLDDLFGQEVTTFRTDDRHELCDPKKLQVKSRFKKHSYEMEIFLPSECLEGYDPNAFDRMGFAYRINRKGKNPKHFALSSDYMVIENQPSLWCSMEMKS